MRISLKLEEVDRGKLKLGTKQKSGFVSMSLTVSYRPSLDWISPIAAVNFRGWALTEKTFPTARAQTQQLDNRLRPHRWLIVIESQPAAPSPISVRASFMKQRESPPSTCKCLGQIRDRRSNGKRNDTDMIVLKGLREGAHRLFENPIELDAKEKMKGKRR